MIYAIEHRMGASLVEARHPPSALAKARRYFGECAEPIQLHPEQGAEIARIKAMGGGVI